ncbi:MAG: MFS transporter [Ruminococcaceae bacterium]|nr:MFS transporter [Oscillospiraceae bacterium]
MNTKAVLKRTVYLCAFIYFISYITRINYGAIIAEMVADTGLSKSALSTALTGSFITYGAGQVVSGIFGDRYQPKHLVALGLAATVIMNILLPLCTSSLMMTTVWCVNGFAQSFMWPPIVKLLTSLLTHEEYAHDCIKVSWGGSLGTIAVYLLSPALIVLSGWRCVFWVSAAFGVLGLLLWWRLCPVISMAPTVKNKASAKKADVLPLFSLLGILTMLSIVLQGILRDGVTTWMPSYISETYHLGEAIAILTGVLLPLFGMAMHYLAGMLYRKVFTNPMFCTGVLFAAGTISSLMLVCFTASNAAVSVFFSALLNGCMHGANLLLVCIVPPLLAKGNNVSTASGVLNACTYVGSALSTYAFPLIAENAGWSATLTTWLWVGLTGTTVTLLCVPLWKRSQTH